MAPTALQSEERVGADLVPGADVEVRNRFDRHWVGGFLLHAVDRTGAEPRYRIRRHSDGAVLPVLFDPADVRIRGAASGTFSAFG